MAAQSSCFSLLHEYIEVLAGILLLNIWQYPQSQERKYADAISIISSTSAVRQIEE